MSQGNVEIVRAVWDAYARRDVEAMQDRCTPDVVLTQPPEMPDPKRYDGHQGLAQSIEDWPRQWDDFQLDVVEVIDANESQVVAMTRQRGRGHTSGLELDFYVAFVLTLRDGKISRGDMFFERDQALEAVGLAE
jgi:ketosteroid isomerase-like protein